MIHLDGCTHAKQTVKVVGMLYTVPHTIEQDSGQEPFYRPPVLRTTFQQQKASP